MSAYDYRPDCAVCPTRPYTPLDAQKPHYVYRLFGGEGRLVYVGCTRNPKARIGTHRVASWWFYLVASQRVTVYHDRIHALMREREAIANENPRFNIQGRWQHRALWNADDYIDYHAAIVFSADVNETSTYNRSHLVKVRQEAARRYGVTIANEASA